MTTTSTFSEDFAGPLDWVEMYRACGLQAIPALTPREDAANYKRPVGAWKEFEEVLIPEATIERWYGQGGPHRGRTNMGLITGACSGGVFCVDLDVKDGSQADAWWHGLVETHNNGIEPETPWQRTGGGGRQLLFRAPEGWVPPTFKTPIGIDIRGQGGFMVAPPSMHGSGRRYEWAPGAAPYEIEIESAPEWLIEAIEALREEHGGTPTGPRERTASGSTNAFGLDDDGREEKLQRKVWRAVVDLYRESPILPGREEQEVAKANVFGWYLSTTAPRIARVGLSKEELLELEGRGRSELERKWRYAMKKWDKEVRAAAAEPAPHRKADHEPAPQAEPISEEAAAEMFALSGFTGEVPSPRPWAYGTILMFGAVTGIAAPPGVGKTTFSVQLAIAYGMGLSFGPWEPRPGGGGKAWLYNGEEPHEELDRRFLAACIEMGVENHVAAACVHYNSGLSERLTLLRQDPKTGEMIRSPHVDIIKRRIRENGITLFIVDPLIEFHDAKEDTESFHALGAVLREIAHDCGCAVLFFHHTPKAANSDTAAGDMNAMRGGGPIIGVARFVATMFNMTAKDADFYGVPATERVKFVRFDDAKANMALTSGEAQWWTKLGISIGNADQVRPSDNIGVLRFHPLSTSEEESTPARMKQRQTTLERIAEEMARVCQANGHTTPETASALDPIVGALDLVKTGVAKTKARELVNGEMGSGAQVEGGRVVITTVPRGTLTVRKVHFEGVEG